MKAKGMCVNWLVWRTSYGTNWKWTYQVTIGASMDALIAHSRSWIISSMNVGAQPICIVVILEKQLRDSRKKIVQDSNPS